MICRSFVVRSALSLTLLVALAVSNVGVASADPLPR